MGGEAMPLQMAMLSEPRLHHGPWDFHRDIRPANQGPLDGIVAGFLRNRPAYLQWNVPLLDDSVLWVKLYHPTPNHSIIILIRLIHLSSGGSWVAQAAEHPRRGRGPAGHGAALHAARRQPTLANQLGPSADRPPNGYRSSRMF